MLKPPLGHKVVSNDVLSKGMRNHVVKCAETADSVSTLAAFVNGKCITITIGPGEVLCSIENRCYVVKSRLVQVERPLDVILEVNIIKSSGSFPAITVSKLCLGTDTSSIMENTEMKGVDIISSAAFVGFLCRDDKSVSKWKEVMTCTSLHSLDNKLIYRTLPIHHYLVKHRWWGDTYLIPVPILFLRLWYTVIRVMVTT